ncbi:MAG TPA: hypothetical protein VGG92_04040 [Caulobacteraceae bacterium]|jgi:nucleoside 2-deoxyribosyltransferase
MPKLSAFVSHAFDDATYVGGKVAFRAAILALLDRVQKIVSDDTGAVTIEPYFDASEIGRPLPAQLRRELDACDLVIADVSTAGANAGVRVNENVLYELGYAMALGKSVLLVRRQTSAPPPADVRDILAASYALPEELPDLLEGPLALVVARLLSAGGDTKGTGRDVRVKRTWFDPGATTIHIICAPEPERSRFASLTEPNYLFIDNLEDRDALLEVSTFLARQYPRAILCRHSADTVAPDVLEGNLVVLGGPGVDEGEGNKITRQLMRSMQSTVRYPDDVDGICFGDGAAHLAEKAVDDSIELDWGCIIAAQNPINQYARVVICQGIFTCGTLGAVLALSDGPASMSNHLLLGDSEVFDPVAGGHQFEAIFPVSVVANGKISAPKLRSDLLRRL